MLCYVIIHEFHRVISSYIELPQTNSTGFTLSFGRVVWKLRTWLWANHFGIHPDIVSYRLILLPTRLCSNIISYHSIILLHHNNDNRPTVILDIFNNCFYHAFQCSSMVLTNDCDKIQDKSYSRQSIEICDIWIGLQYARLTNL